MKLTVREAASVLDVSETKIYRWVDHEVIPFVMIHHQPVFHRLELLEWAMEMELPIRVDLYEDGHDLPFATALERGGGHMIGDRLDEIAGSLPVPASDREAVREVLVSRESELFVGRPGDLIAIPKARSPIICPDVPSAVSLWWCGHRAVVINNARRSAIFLIVAPTVRCHLQLLSRLSLALHDPGFRDAVKRAGAFDGVIVQARRWESSATGATP